jgi:hypothetical protein
MTENQINRFVELANKKIKESMEDVPNTIFKQGKTEGMFNILNIFYEVKNEGLDIDVFT